jgi:hypothetical protein
MAGFAILAPPTIAQPPWHGIASGTVRSLRGCRWIPWGRRIGGLGEALDLAPKDSTTEESFQGAEMSMIVRSQKADGFAHGLGPPRPADPVDVILGMTGEVVVDDVGNTFHVDAPGSDIGGHQDPDPSRLKVLQGPQALVLGAVGMKRRHRDSFFFKTSGDPVGPVFGAGKDQNSPKFIVF